MDLDRADTPELRIAVLELVRHRGPIDYWRAFSEVTRSRWSLPAEGNEDETPWEEGTDQLLARYAGKGWLASKENNKAGHTLYCITPEGTEELTLLEATIVPASDRYVSRSDNIAAIEALSGKIEIALRAIERSNTIEPDQKARWIEQIKEGLDNLKQPKFLLSVFAICLGKPIYDAYCSVVEESAKPQIREALEAIAALVGSVS